MQLAMLGKCLSSCVHNQNLYEHLTKGLPFSRRRESCLMLHDQAEIHREVHAE
jgi:hypothetical protein